MKRGSDVCYCGDYRSQHKEPNGFCFCGCTGYKEGRPATKVEQQHWNEFHGPKSPWRREIKRRLKASHER